MLQLRFSVYRLGENIISRIMSLSAYTRLCQWVNNIYKLNYDKLIEIQFITYLVKYGTYESHLSSHDHLDNVYSQ